MQPDRAPSAYVTVAVLAASSLTVMANATISPGLPGLEAHFAEVPGIRTLAGLVVTLPSLFVILAASLVGWLADRLNRRRMLAVSMVVYALGGVSGLFLSSIEGILVGRAVLGLGVAGTMTLAITLAGDLWQGPARQRFIGLQSSAMAAGGVVFITLGGVLAGLGWRMPFLVYLAAIPIAVMVQHALRSVDTRPGNANAAGDAPAPHQPFPWRAVAPAYAAAFFFMVSFYLIPTRLPFLLADMGIGSPNAAAAAMASATLVSIPGAMLYGRLRRVLSGAQVFALGFGLMGTGLAVVSLASGLAGVLPGTMIAGAGMGAMMPNFSTYMMSRVPAAHRGRASGMLTTSIFSGQFVSPFLSAPLAAWLGLSGGFLAFGAALVTVAAGIALASPRGPSPHTVES